MNPLDNLRQKKNEQTFCWSHVPPRSLVPSTPPPPPPPPVRKYASNGVEQKVLALLKENEVLTLAQIAALAPEYSRKCLSDATWRLRKKKKIKCKPVQWLSYTFEEDKRRLPYAEKVCKCPP